MAYVIAVCGSGGKTTYCKNVAKTFADENKKVCILTTTHMWNDILVNDLSEIEKNIAGQIYYFGKVEGGKICYVGDEYYKKICEKFDYVVVEADGSRSMPMKIPRTNDIIEHDTSDKKCEPVIPDNVNEIVIIVGKEAIGREIESVCHRFDEYYGKDKFLADNNILPNTIVTSDIIDRMVLHYYYEPLSKKYDKAKIKIHKVGFDENSKTNVKKVCIALCAAGFSTRFGNENKLFYDCKSLKFAGENRKSVDSNDSYLLYQLMIDKILDAKKLITEKLGGYSCDNKFDIDVAVITKYDRIINDGIYNKQVAMIKNEKAAEGLSSSVKLAVDKYKDYDAIAFINCDLPNLPSRELANFIYSSIFNNTDIAAMYTDRPKNPAYFEKNYFDELSKISGDVGAKELLQKSIKKLYKYFINPKYLVDVDEPKDFENFS